MAIEWTDETMNPIRARRRSDGVMGWHCEKVSPGCANCYAETMNRAARFWGTGYRYTPGARNHIEVFLDGATVDRMARKRARRRVFLCDMTDIFADFVSDAALDRLFRSMSMARNVTWQLLTKRPARMREYITSRADGTGVYFGNVPDNDLMPWPLPNVWLGVSVEDQEAANQRLPILMDTPAAVRWASVEPLLSHVDLRPWLGTRCDSCGQSGHTARWAPRNSGWDNGHVVVPDDVCGPLSPSDHEVGLDWIVVGGESGSASRPCDLTWLRNVVDDSTWGEVPVFVKQLGNRPQLAGEPWAPYGGHRIRGHRGQYTDDWPQDLIVREFPAEGR